MNNSPMLEPRRDGQVPDSTQDVNIKMNQQKHRLLIFDDDSSIGQSMILMANHFEVEAQFASDFVSFFELVWSWRPTHIILDLLMPNMDGLSVLNRLAEEHCDAQIAISSGMCGRDLSDAKKIAVQLGLSVTAVLPKPVRLNDLKNFLAASD